jgi:hypothetical protein
VNSTPPEMLIHLPDAISWWPLAIGWWLIIPVIAFSLIILIRFLIARYRRQKPMKAALKQLKNIQTNHQKNQNDLELMQQLSILLRQAALSYFGRASVAGLTGERWLSYIDQYSSTPYFTRPPANEMVIAPYKNEANIEDAANIISHVKIWLKTANKAATC